jgi:hypothetical protein
VIRRTRRSVLSWDAFLIAGGLAVGVILALERWPITNIRLALLAIFALELVVALTGGLFGEAWARSGMGPGTGGLYGFMSPSARYIDSSARRLERETWHAGRLDPIAIGPAIALALLLLSLLIF